MSSILNISTFFKYFIYHPDSDFLNDQEKRIAGIASRILSYCTFNMLPSYCQRVWKNQSIWTGGEEKIIKQRIQSAIRSIQNENRDKDLPCHQIINQLYLGNSEAFISTTHLKFRDVDRSYRCYTRTTNNAPGFESVITMCQMKAIYGDFIELSGQDFQETFANHKVQWLNLGYRIFDGPEAWPLFIHDCTIAEEAIPLDDKMEVIQIEALVQQKNETIQRINSSEWFVRAFKEIDRAVFHDRKVLVHCQAGVSRSATLLAAYLINRFGVTHTEALDFLQIKRPVVKSKFEAQLAEYSEKLK